MWQVVGEVGEHGQVEGVQVFLDMIGEVPALPLNSPQWLPVSGTCAIQGVSDVLAGHAEQNAVKKGEEVDLPDAQKFESMHFDEGC